MSRGRVASRRGARACTSRSTCRPGSESWTSCTPTAMRRSGCSSATRVARARPASPGTAWTSRSRRATGRSSPRRPSPTSPTARSPGRWTGGTWTRCATTSCGRPGWRRTRASMCSRSTSRTVTCWQASSRRSRTVAPTNTADRSRTGCGFRSRCSTPCARCGPSTSRSRCASPPWTGHRAGRSPPMPWRSAGSSRRTAATSSTCRRARRCPTPSPPMAASSRRPSPVASGTRPGSRRWRSATSRPTPTSTRSSRRGAPISASWRARISGTPTGRAMPPTRWATSCPGRPSMGRSTTTSRGSREALLMPVSYSSYLKLDELLSLQQPRSTGPEHDEMLFIVIHQVYELWFKEMLHELDYLKTLLRDNETPRALHTLKRILTVLKVMVAQIDVLETMTPLEFLSFRDRLESGSGFQSFQFRELEFVLGVKNPAAIGRYPEGSDPRGRLEARFGQATLWDAFLAYLAKNRYAVPPSLLGRDVTRRPELSPEMQQVLITVYRTNPSVSSVCERLVDLDEGVMEWRDRHGKKGQGPIRTKTGTGGDAGARDTATTR